MEGELAQCETLDEAKARGRTGCQKDCELECTCFRMSSHHTEYDEGFLIDFQYLMKSAGHCSAAVKR